MEAMMTLPKSLDLLRQDIERKLAELNELLAFYELYTKEKDDPYRTGAKCPQKGQKV
jgi:hypothetical protein